MKPFIVTTYFRSKRGSDCTHVTQIDATDHEDATRQAQDRIRKLNHFSSIYAGDCEEFAPVDIVISGQTIEDLEQQQRKYTDADVFQFGLDMLEAGMCAGFVNQKSIDGISPSDYIRTHLDEL